MTKKDEIALNVKEILMKEGKFLSLKEIYNKYIESYGEPGKNYDSYIRGSIYRHCLDRDLLYSDDEIYFYSLSPKKSRGNQFGLIEWNNDNVDDVDDIISRIPYKPQYEEDNELPKTSVSIRETIIRRKASMAIALIRANYTCEVDEKHPSFIRKSNLKNYTEAHHLIPLEYQNEFNHSLDIPDNIVSLCSNCHNQLHYGIYKEDILRKLYEERKDKLKKNKIEISFEQLCKFYNL